MSASSNFLVIYFYQRNLQTFRIILKPVKGDEFGDGFELRELDQANSFGLIVDLLATRQPAAGLKVNHYFQDITIPLDNLIYNHGRRPRGELGDGPLKV